MSTTCPGRPSASPGVGGAAGPCAGPGRGGARRGGRVAFAYPARRRWRRPSVVVVGPPVLGVRGRTSPLAFTRRLRLLAAVWLVLQARRDRRRGTGAPRRALGGPRCRAPCHSWSMPPVPCSARSSAGWSRPTSRRRGLACRRWHPIVVAITGSFGKTSTKQHVAHLVAGSRTVVASPASFNNRAGLARAVNEQLTPGTDVFVAEMGTYGKGEIADLCRWCPPAIAVITAIGPVHLERFKTRGGDRRRQVRDHRDGPHGRAQRGRPRIWPRWPIGWRPPAPSRSCGAPPPTRRPTSVSIGTGGVATVHVDGSGASGPRSSFPAPCSPPTWPARWRWPLRVSVPPRGGDRPHRQASHGAQPAGFGRGAVGGLGDRRHVQFQPERCPGGPGRAGGHGAGGRRVVVTPGMVELGRRQFEENRAFAQAAPAWPPTW